MPTTTWTTSANAEDFYLATTGSRYYATASQSGTIYPSVAHKVTSATMIYSSVTVIANGNYSAIFTSGGSYTSSACGTWGTGYSTGSPISVSVSCNTGTYSAGGGYYPANGLGVLDNNNTGMICINTGCTITLTVVWELLGSIWINVGGTWKQGEPWVNVSGTWKQGETYINVGGVWKQGI